MEFENKPVRDWTLAEAKKYCEKHYGGETYCLGEGCVLNDTKSCIGVFKDMKLKNKSKFSQNEIMLCQMIKKTYPWAKYIFLDEPEYIVFTEERPTLDEGQFWVSPTSLAKIIPDIFFPNITSFELYVVDDIIALDDTES